MFKIRYAEQEDKEYWYSLEHYMNENEFNLKVRDKRGYIISDDETPVGIMRYGLFWDNMPFLNLIYLEDAYRGKGLGKSALLYWEEEMKSLGYKLLMTSTQADEDAQFFYRKLNYKDAGCLIINQTEPTELFMVKSI